MNTCLPTQQIVTPKIHEQQVYVWQLHFNHKGAQRKHRINGAIEKHKLENDKMFVNFEVK